MATCDLTIGIPLRNEEESIHKCLASILQSDLPPHAELVVCDNASTDGSLSYVRSYARHMPIPLTIVSESQLGKAFAMNKIIAVARSNYVVFCDADILVGRDTIRRIHELLATSDFHLVGIRLVDISRNGFFRWYYRQLARVQKDDLDGNVMGGCFGINKARVGLFPPVLSTDFFMSAYYYFGNKQAHRDDAITAYYKRPNTIGDVLMKKTRNRLKHLQIRREFPHLSSFRYEPPLDVKRLLRRLDTGTLLAASLYLTFEAAAFVVGTAAFYAKRKHVGCTWRKARSTKLHDVAVHLADVVDVLENH